MWSRVKYLRYAPIKPHERKDPFLIFNGKAHFWLVKPSLAERTAPKTFL